MIWNSLSVLFTDLTYSASKLQSDLSKLLLLSKENVKISNEFHEVMKDEENPAVAELMSKILSATEMNIAASDRSDDPDWFAGDYLQLL